MLASSTPDTNVHGANMEPFLGRQVPGGHHVDPMNFVIWNPLLHMLPEGPLPEHNKALVYPYVS